MTNGTPSSAIVPDSCFAWRESLRKHDRAWYQRMGENYDPIAADVSVSLNSEPLGEKLFRPCPETTAPATSPKASFPSSPTHKLSSCSMRRLWAGTGNRPSPAICFFFHQPWVQKFPLSRDAVSGRAAFRRRGRARLGGHHTGASPQDAGEVKKVRLDVGPASEQTVASSSQQS